MTKGCRGCYGKGVGAEADAVAGILAGSTENIRPVVAKAKSYRKTSGRSVARAFWDSFAAIFFICEKSTREALSKGTNT